jgi:hypothetical protein
LSAKKKVTKCARYRNPAILAVFLLEFIFDSPLCIFDELLIEEVQFAVESRLQPFDQARAQHTLRAWSGGRDTEFGL